MRFLKRLFGAGDRQSRPPDGRALRATAAAPPRSAQELAKDLIKAVEDGKSAMVRELVERGADVNAKASWGETGLGLASREGRVEVVRELLASGADVNARDRRGWTALMAAAKARQRDVMQVLLGNGAAQDLFVAAILGDVALVRALLDKGADVNAAMGNRETALFLASERRDREVVQELLNRGAVQDVFGAAILGDCAVMRALLEKGADVNAKTSEGATALVFASRGGHLEVVQELLLKGADVNAKSRGGWTALTEASSEGHHEVVQTLLANGAEVNGEVDTLGHTALTWAVGHNHLKVVQVLLDNGATDKGGKALKSASYFRYLLVERALLRKCAPQLADATDPNVQEEFDRLWVEATLIQKKNIMRGIGGSDEGDMFVKRYVYEHLIERHRLEPEEFGRLEMNFRRGWHPSFSKGWERN